MKNPCLKDRQDQESSRKRERKKAFDDFDGEEAKTLTTTRKRG
jgi:hypothetical protein